MPIQIRTRHLERESVLFSYCDELKDTDDIE